MNSIKTFFIDFIYRIVISHIVPNTQLPLLEADFITEETSVCVVVFAVIT